MGNLLFHDDDAYIRLSKPNNLSCARGMDGFNNGGVLVDDKGVVFGCGRKEYAFTYDQISSVEKYKYATIPYRVCLSVKTTGTPSELYITFFGFTGTKKGTVDELQKLLSSLIQN